MAAKENRKIGEGKKWKRQAGIYIRPKRKQM